MKRNVSNYFIMLLRKFFQELPAFHFIITYVDDGSKDNTLDEIKRVVETANEGLVQYIALSRNFGKEAAMYAGLKESTGDYVAIMDVDLQDPPELIPEMYETLLKKQYDCVATKRKTRKGENFIISFFSKLFYKNYK